MQWTKIATDLIERRFTDYEIASIVKFQLIWAINEEQPDKKTALRYMTHKQYETAMTYIDSIAARVCDDVSSVMKKRNAEKLRYCKNKGFTKNLQAECEQTVGSLSEQIRLDKIREDKIREDMRGEYKNVYLPEDKLREYEVYCMGKEVAKERIEYLSQQIEQGKDDAFNEKYPNAHFVRLKQLFDNYKKSVATKRNIVPIERPKVPRADW